MKKIVVKYIDEASSTNDDIKKLTIDSSEMLILVANRQTTGRGCGSNSWESEAGKNLTFSVRYHPDKVDARHQFVISMQTAVALCRTMNDFGIITTIKWPNDIYYGDMKLAGILIENRLRASTIEETIIGIGLNINQTHFTSDAPNPISMKLISGKEYTTNDVLDTFLHYFSVINTDIYADYRSLLYRSSGFYRYIDKNGEFTAEIAEIAPDGIISLRDTNGTIRKYAFKEVAFCI